MCEDGVQPTTKTFTTLISTFSKMGSLESALNVFSGLVMREAEKPDSPHTGAVYSALMAACEKAGQWELAVALYEKVRRLGRGSSSYDWRVQGLGL
jgi:pentatricopeptide repeat domain-containing protein 1